MYLITMNGHLSRYFNFHTSTSEDPRLHKNNLNLSTSEDPKTAQITNTLFIKTAHLTSIDLDPICCVVVKYTIW